MKTENSTEASCPVCGSSAREWDNARDVKNSELVYRLFKCIRCGHGFFYPGVKNKEELRKGYDETYAGSYNPEVQDASLILREQQYRLDLEFLRRFVSDKELSVLDFGCSTGQFLNAMPPGWRKFGFEVNRFEVDYISKHCRNITIFSELADVAEEEYDLITLRGVIEHLFDFKELFDIIDRSLKKGGIVYVCATPDFDSPCASLYKSQWNQIAAPLHYHQFTAASLSILFGMNGFGLKALHHPYLETPYAHFEQDARKFIGNCRRIIEGEQAIETMHPYPANMMSLILQRIGGRQ